MHIVFSQHRLFETSQVTCPDNDENPLVKAYHRVLVWDMMSAPRLTRLAERSLNPIIGKLSGGVECVKPSATPLIHA